MISLPPDNTKVYLKAESKTFCFPPNQTNPESLVTISQAKEMKYKVEQKCEDSFKQEISLLDIILEKTGLQKTHSRWDSNGNWNW